MSSGQKKEIKLFSICLEGQQQIPQGSVVKFNVLISGKTEQIGSVQSCAGVTILFGLLTTGES